MEVFTAWARQENHQVIPVEGKMTPRDIEKVFNDLYACNHEMVIEVIECRVNCHAVAADLEQEVFMKLWNFLHTGEELENPGAWLSRVARNVINDFYRRAPRSRGHASIDHGDPPADPQPSPLEQLEMAETIASIGQDIHSLKPKELAVIKDLLEGYTAKETSSRLNCSKRNVQLHLHNARERLKKKLLQ